MILPRGVNKGSGLKQALDDLGVLNAATVGVGDAQNDMPLLQACALGVAVANALPEVKAAAHWITAGARGEGVRQLIARMMADDWG